VARKTAFEKSKKKKDFNQNGKAGVREGGGGSKVESGEIAGSVVRGKLSREKGVWG